MRILALLIHFVLATVIRAQVATPVAPPADGEILPPAETADADSTATDETRAGALERPFLQTDLELMVGNVQRPNGIVWFDNALYTVCNGDWTIYKIDDRTGDTVTFVFGVRNGNNIIAEETDSGFDLWVPDPDTGNLWKVDQRREAPISVAEELEAPWGVLRLNAESFLVTDTRANAILELPPGAEARIAVSELRAPTGIVRAGNTVYFANGGSARRGIEYFEIEADGAYSPVKPLVSGLQNTSNIAIGVDGYLYFSYALGTRGVIGRIDPSQCLESGCDNQDVEIVVFSDIPAPLAIALSPDMRLFLHSRFRPEFYWVQLPAS